MINRHFESRRVSLVAWVFAFLLSLLALPIDAAAKKPPKSWAVTTLGSLGPRGAIALTLNNRGEVGGYSAWEPADRPGDWYYHPFIWSNGTMTDVGTQIGSPPGRSFNQVSLINDRGTYVTTGYAGILVWRDGVSSTLGFEFGTANDLNNKDVVVGSYPYGLGGHAYMWRDGIFTDIGTLGGQYSNALAVNDKGAVVGVAHIAGNDNVHAFLYEKGTMTDLGTLGGMASRAEDINSHGVVIGQAEDANGVMQPFIYDKSGMRRMENVPTGATLFAINDHGVVLGTYPNANHQGETTFLWDDGEMTIVNTLPEVKAAGWGSIFVTDMNDRGQITGWGWKTGGNPNGEAFLLSPK